MAVVLNVRGSGNLMRPMSPYHLVGFHSGWAILSKEVISILSGSYSAVTSWAPTKTCYDSGFCVEFAMLTY